MIRRLFRAVPIRQINLISKRCCQSSNDHLRRIAELTTGAKGYLYRECIKRIMDKMYTDEALFVEARKRFISKDIFARTTMILRRLLATEPQKVLTTSELLEEYLSAVETQLQTNSLSQPTSSFYRLLTNCNLRLCEEEFAADIASYKAMLTFCDLRAPHEWYPLARLLRRKVIFHGGPTNSGKTYHALQRLRQANPAYGGGVYCGPLRLLALEVYDQLNRQGIYCDLITGQEKREIPGSTHVSCTVEIVRTNREYDVGVIDEIQMIADPQRGHAWTRAVLGLPVRELHLCGGMEALDIVKNIALHTGDDLEIRNYERMSELIVENESLGGDYSKVQSGDCIVAFSKADIFSIKREIENLTKFKCCVIYGQLPSETRSSQARLFNDENSGFDILIASDAIGMGLNLNIRRVIFHNTLKKSQGGTQHVSSTAVKQIAGRAGRRSSRFSQGYVTTWQEEDLTYVKEVMKQNIPVISQAGLFPTIDQIESFSKRLQDTSTTPLVENATVAADETAAPRSLSQADTKLSTLVERFIEVSQLGGEYFLTDHFILCTVANFLHTIPLSLPDRFIFSNCPVNVNNAKAMQLLYEYAASYARKIPVSSGVYFPRRKPRDVQELSDICVKHNCLDMYIWLANQFPKYFIERDLCLEMKEFSLKIIQDALINSYLDHQYSHSEMYRMLRDKVVLGPDGLCVSISDSLRSPLQEAFEKTPHVRVPVFPNEGFSGEMKIPPRRYERGAKNDKSQANAAPFKDLPSNHQYKTNHRYSNPSGEKMHTRSKM